LNGAEFAVDYGHHALNLLGRDGPCARLLSQKVHYMVGELTAGLEQREIKSLNAVVKRWDKAQVLFSAVFLTLQLADSSADQTASS